MHCEVMVITLYALLVTALSICGAAHLPFTLYKTFNQIRTELEGCGISRYMEGIGKRFQMEENSNNVLWKSKRIVGGIRSRQAEWPWLVSLRNRNTYLKSFFNHFKHVVHRNHYCGGVLIHPEWILSAAHCFRNKQFMIYQRTFNMDFELDSACAWKVVLGEHDINTDEGHEHEVEVRKIFMPDSNDAILKNADIALLRLRRKAPTNEFIRPACLPLPEDTVEPGTICTIAGWGREKFSALEHSEKLMHAKVRLVTKEICKAAYPSNTSDVLDLDAFDANVDMCAAGDDYKTDACQFDSGGPLMCKKNGVWKLTGVVSRGNECAMEGYPGIYTNVTSALAWIEKTIYENQL